MFDFLKNLTKSEEEKRQEAFSAYLDETLSAKQRREFEALLAEDADLRAEIELAQRLRQQMAELPRRSLPRSFTLDTSQYGAPRKEPLVQAYPLLRAATAMTAVFFVLALGLSVFTMQGGGNAASMAETAMEPAPAFDAPMAEAEIMVEATAEMLSTEKVAKDTAIAATEIVVEEVVVEAEEEALPLSTQAEIVEGAAAEADSLRELPTGAVDGETATATPTATPLPTATISTLPRLEATETAVPRVNGTTGLPDEVAHAVEGETAVVPAPDTQPRQSFTISQALLIGLGLLLLLLLVVTLLARRKI